MEFVKQYISIYDSNSRQPLLNAYHENAVMSMSTAYPPNAGNQPSKP